LAEEVVADLRRARRMCQQLEKTLCSLLTTISMS
jgi:hypothetical protein